MTRIGLPAASALALALLASGCGGGSGSGNAKDVAPTKAQATASAKAINLVKADFPGYSSTPADNSDTSGGALPDDVATCLGVSAKDAGDDDIVDLSSDDFAKGSPPDGAQVSSEVEVVPSTSGAKKLLATFKGGKASDCLGKSFEKELKSQIGTSTPGVTVGKVTVTTLSPSATDTDGSFGFKLVIPVQGPGITIAVTTEIRGFLKRHTEVTLLTVTYGTSTKVDSEALFAKLVARAKTSAV
ncbi:MAG: hypothetical protein JWO22_2438 [Frankiales bacterium]|nr:hypothetical protein [Frankiales bacterium]